MFDDLGPAYLHPIKAIGWVKNPAFKIVGWAPKTVFAMSPPRRESCMYDDADVDEFPEVAAPKARG